MEWYYYVSQFFAGMFLANAIPHFVNGISGDVFPTPFAKPPGKGLSSPVINVVWALVNIVIGFLLYRFGKVSFQDNVSLLVFFSAFSFTSILLGKGFAKKEKR